MVDYSNIPRDSRRVPIATKVQFKFDRFSGFISEYSSNISPTGMYIVTENPEPAGRILDLEFRLGDGFEIIKGQGEVVWVRSAPNGPNRPPGMGIRFLELSPGSHDLIYRIVDRFVAQGGTPFDLTGVRDAPPPPDFPEPPAVAAPSPEPLLPPLSRAPDPFPELEERDERPVTVIPWASPPKETMMPGGDVLPPLEPLDEIFRLEETPPIPESGAAAPPAPAAVKTPPAPGVLPFPGPPPGPSPATPLPALALPADEPFPALEADLDLTQAGPTVVGFDEPIPDPPSYPDSKPSLSGSLPGSSNDLFASYLPQPVAPPETPQVRPLATLAGGASVQQPRRIFPLVLIGILLAVAAAVFFLRDRIMEWTGFGGGEEIVTAEQRPQLPRPAAPPPDATLQEEMGGLATDLSAQEPPPASAPAEPAEETAPPPVQPQAAAPPTEPEARPLPEVVQRKPAPGVSAAPAAPAGPAVTVVERITFEQAPGGTTVILWGNGAMRPESYKRIGVDSPPREVIQIRGIQRSFSPLRIPVGTPEVKQIRVGYHERPGGNELHVVIDLAGARVKATRVEPDGQRLRIHLQAQ